MNVMGPRLFLFLSELANKVVGLVLTQQAGCGEGADGEGGELCAVQRR